MHFHIITAFPEVIRPTLEASMLKRAIKTGKVDVSVYDLRSFSNDPHKKIDARPYGGGPGMVLKAEPILRAHKKAKGRKKDVLTVLLSPRGMQYTSTLAKKYARKYRHIILICGHYEGIDARVQKILKPIVVSVGPYVLTGGELPALIVLDSISRYIPGVLGNDESLEEDRIAPKEVYTRPETIRADKKTYNVPKVLLSGDHKKIEMWKKETRALDNKKLNA